MSQENQIKFTDKILSSVFFWLPHSVKPNYLTILRLILVPVVAVLLIKELFIYALITFWFAAFTDALDGAFARTRNQITNFGKLADPFADKMLIVTSLFVLSQKFLNPVLLVFVVIMEVILISWAVFRKFYYNETVQAEASGKMKMGFQVLATTLLIFFPVLHWIWLKKIAVYFLWTAVIFAAISISRRAI